MTEPRRQTRPPADLHAWLTALESRHLSDLRFPEVTRALRALSSTYVERRGRLLEGAALSSAGKRAAFALFYGPLHAILLRAMVAELPGATTLSGTLVDLGCGTGAASAGWALACLQPPTLQGLDRHPWAVTEANLTYRELGVRGRAAVADITQSPLPVARGYLAAFTLNELGDDARRAVLSRLLDRAERGAAVLIVEPLATRVSPWWSRELDPFRALGARLDEWRFSCALPPLVAKLDRAAGLRHSELTGRSLWIAGASTSAATPTASS